MEGGGVAAHGLGSRTAKYGSQCSKDLLTNVQLLTLVQHFHRESEYIHSLDCNINAILWPVAKILQNSVTQKGGSGMRG